MRKYSSYSSRRQLQAQQLQKEIDKLALLLQQTKRQSDKIQAAADAMGEAIFCHLDGEKALTGRAKRGKTGPSVIKQRTRSRADGGFPIPARPSDMLAARP